MKKKRTKKKKNEKKNRKFGELPVSLLTSFERPNKKL